jgi:histidyl-tRNA synthetase
VLEAPVLVRVRGTMDFVPPQAAVHRQLLNALLDFLARYGYALIETPVLEPTELFLRKAGEELAARIYAFTHWNRRLCLRPEFTASVIRAYLQELRHRPLPLRLAYSGPTFRYEKPQRGRYRQFTEVGGELIGAAGPAADAEVLAAACGALEQVGVRDYRLVVGHLGVALQLLAQLGIDERGQALIIGQLEALARKQADPTAVIERVALLLGAPAGDASADGRDDGALGALLAQFGAEEAARLATALLHHASLPLDGGVRSPAEIVERLLAKAARPDPTPRVRTAVEFLQQLHGLAGPPAEAFGRLEALLNEYRLAPDPLRELADALDHFAHYGLHPGEIVVDLSLARGLRYYTGLVFEVYDDGPEGPLQLCGGGRYDGLVRALGGPDQVPACGFSIGLERTRLALESRGALPPPPGPPAVVVIPVEPADHAVAVAAARALRARGLCVELDLRQRGLKLALRHADREGVPLAVIVGERERATDSVVLRELATKRQRAVPLVALPDAVVAALGAAADGAGTDGREEQADG